MDYQILKKKLDIERESVCVKPVYNGMCDAV